MTTLIPVNPVEVLFAGNQDATPEMKAALRHELGLDLPFLERFSHYVVGLFRGDMGLSFFTRQPVSFEIASRIRATLELAVFSFVLMLAIGIPIGVICATKRNSVTDFVLRIFSLGGVSMSSFWVGLILQLVFYSSLRILPLGGRVSSFVPVYVPITSITGFYTIDSLITGNLLAFSDVLKHLILPGITLSYAGISSLMRITRSSMLDVLNQDYVRTARASGFPERVVTYIYALKNALIPVITVLGLQFGRLIEGSVLIETIFDWPGLGFFMVRSILNLDYPSVIGVSLVICIMFVLVNLLVDVVYTFVDPRIKM
jgi:peptide/nickel transport system permease protein